VLAVVYGKAVRILGVKTVPVVLVILCTVWLRQPFQVLAIVYGKAVQYVFWVSRQYLLY